MKQKCPDYVNETEESRERANILSVLIWASWSVFLVVILTGLTYQDWKLIAITAAGCALLLAPYNLVKRGYLHAGGLLIALIIIFLLTLIATVGQGIRDIALVAYPVVLIFAGMTLNRAYFRLSVGLTLAAVGWLVFGETFGWYIPAPYDGQSLNLILFIIAISIILVAAFAVDLLATNMRKNLARAQQEIVQRKLAEEKVETREKRFQALIEHGRDNISLLAADGTLLWENPASGSTLGYAPNQFVGHNIFELMHPDDQGWTRDMYEKVVHSPGNIQEGEFRLLHADGTWRWIECSAANLFDEPSVQAIVLNYRDITKRKQAESQREAALEALWESEERFKLSMDATNDGLWDWNIKTDGGYFSPGYYRMLGYEVDDFPVNGNSWKDLIHPDDRERAQRVNMDCIEGRCEQFEVEYRMKARNGEWRWILGRGKCVERDEQGRALRLLGTHMDITERKRTEDALMEKEFQYRNLADSGIALIWTAGTDKLCNYFNLPWLKFTGRTLEQEMGNGWTKGVHPDDFDRCLETYSTAFDKREKFDMQYRLRHVSGEYRWIQDMGIPNYSNSGDFIGYIGHCFDITERKRLEELLRYQSSTDVSTGIYNRNFFEEELARFERGREYPISIVIADVDGLKNVNDTLGHAVGDELLQHAANVLRTVFRAGDVLARIGGDEFGALLPATDSAAVDQIVSRIREGLAEYNALHADLPLQLSIGAATAEKGNLTEIFTLADQRMYADKSVRKSYGGPSTMLTY
jgi:diguanylate cyclase (GGDEF)-like protein/PAS domain S-box-containing protein